MAAFLEERAACPDQTQVNNALIETLAPQPGELILEVGSGTGVLCRMVIPRVLPRGLVCGLDVASDMTLAARRYAAQHGLAQGLRFETGPAEALPYPDASFDAVFAARLLLHVPDPDAVLREMIRAARPGGRLALMDWDFETLAVDHSDRELTRRIIQWRTDHHSGNNWSGRQLWGRAVAAELYAVRVAPVTTTALNERASLTGSLWRAAEVSREAGAITAAEHDGWVGELKARLAAGRFFASVTYFIVWGERKA